MDIDQEKLDALERDLKDRLTRDIKADVEERLFRKYFAMGAFVTAVLGVFGYSTINTARTTILTSAQAQLRDAQLATTEARKIADETRDQVAVNQSTITSIQNTSTLISTQATGLIERSNRAVLDVERIAKSLPLQIRDAQDGLQGLQTKLNETTRLSSEMEIQLAALRQQRSELAGAGNLEELEANVKAMNTQMIALSQTVQKLARGPSQSAIDGVTTSLGEIQTSFEDPATRTVSASTSKQDIRVFVQFATVPRGVIEGIIANLESRSAFVPEEERTEDARGLHELRYFFAEDEKAAKAIVLDLNRTMRGKFKDAVTLRPLLSYKGRKPRIGTLELWLEPQPL